jgi:hypothetical protein
MQNFYFRDVRILEMMEQIEQRVRVPRVIFPRVDPADYLTDHQECFFNEFSALF